MSGRQDVSWRNLCLDNLYSPENQVLTNWWRSSRFLVPLHEIRSEPWTPITWSISFPRSSRIPSPRYVIFLVFEDFLTCRADFSSQYQVFRKASPEAIDLISRLLEYTPTQRLSAIEAMCHPFFDELRDPNTKLPDSRGGQGLRDLPRLFDFSRHGKFISLGFG